MVSDDCAALKDALRLSQQVNSELNEQLRDTRLELAQEMTRRGIVENQLRNLEARLRVETRRTPPGFDKLYQGEAG